MPAKLEAVGHRAGPGRRADADPGQRLRASPAGLAAISIACVCWSAGSVLSQRALPLAPGAMGFASEMICGGVVLLVLAAVSGESLVWPPAPAGHGGLAVLVVFGSLIAFNAYMLLLARRRPRWRPATPSSIR